MSECVFMFAPIIFIYLLCVIVVIVVIVAAAAGDGDDDRNRLKRVLGVPEEVRWVGDVIGARRVDVARADAQRQGIQLRMSSPSVGNGTMVLFFSVKYSFFVNRLMFTTKYGGSLVMA